MAAEILNKDDGLPYQGAKYPWLYGLVVFGVDQFLSHKYDFEVFGSEHMPARGAVVVASKHARAKDPAVVAVGITKNRSWPEKRYVASMGKRPLWTDSRYKKYGFQLGKIIEKVDAFPVDRPEDRKPGDNQILTSGLRTALWLLNRGDAVSISPEGTRQEETKDLHRGAAWLAYVSHAPILPLVIASYLPPEANSSAFKEFVRVLISPPFQVDRELPKAEAITLTTSRLEDIFQRDYTRALGWAAFDAARRQESAKHG